MLRYTMLTVIGLFADVAYAVGGPTTLPGDWSDAVPKVEGTQYFVSPDGKRENAGDKDATWDIASALGGKHTVKPGDVIWLRGGAYKQPERTHESLGFIVRLIGSEKGPVHVRAYPGERAIIDGGLQLGFNGTCQYLWIWDLEILLSDRSIEAKAGGSAPGDLTGPQGGVHVADTKGCKFINLVIHNTYQGISWWNGALDGEIHGCLIYDNGWKAPDRCHGHCIYTQNEKGAKTISGCIMSTPFGRGQQVIQAYGSKAAFVNGFTIEDNIAYSMTQQGDRLLVGGQASGNKNNQANRNYLYNCVLQVGYSGKDHEDCKVNRNVVFNGGSNISNYAQVEACDNLLVSDRLGLTNCVKVVDTGNQTFEKGQRPDKPKSVLIPNKYDPARAHLAVFNWTRSPEVRVTVTPFLKPGDRYRLMDPKKVFDKPLFEGECTGDSITIPVAGEFAAFVVFKGVPVK